MSSQSTEPTYVRLHNLLGAIRELSPFQDLTADEEQLLGQLVVRWHASKRITVAELMQDTSRVSASTIYRRLIGLRDKGLVDLPVDMNDKRSHFVVPTPSAKRYIKHLDQCVLKLSIPKSS